MIELERERFDAARAYCALLIELGEKIREGSERPFAHALDGLCHYALTDETAPLEAALENLRAADAKHRMAYTLTRAALLDVERGRLDTARARAAEALACAEALDRATEMMLAHVALALASRAANDAAGFERRAAAAARLENAPVARWARQRAAALTTPLARPAWRDKLRRPPLDVRRKQPPRLARAEDISTLGLKIPRLLPRSV